MVSAKTTIARALGSSSPQSWRSAARRGFREALRPADRENLAWAASGVLGILVLFWAVQDIAVLRTGGDTDWLSALWFDSQRAMALWAMAIWATAAPCVLLPGFALGDVSDPDGDPILRHGMATGRILALQLPSLLFGAAALALGASRGEVLGPLVTGTAMTLSAAAVAVAIGECHLWDFARRFLLRVSSAVLFVAAGFGRVYFGGTSLSPLPSDVSAAATESDTARAIIGGGIPFDLAFAAFVLLTCARAIAGMRRPAAETDGSRGAWPQATEWAPVLDEEEDALGQESLAQAPLALEPGAGVGAALASAYRGRARLLLLAALPALAVMAAGAPVAQWLQRTPVGNLLAMLAGYAPTSRNPLAADWDWQWTQSSSLALLAAVVAWGVLAGRLVVAPLAARSMAGLRGTGGRGAAPLSGLSPAEAVAWASLPPALPVAAIGLVAGILAALPAYRDGAPADTLVFMVLAGPSQVALCGMLGVVVGLRRQTAKGAEAAARLVAGLGLPAAFALLRWGLSLFNRGLGQPDRFVWSVGCAYQEAVVVSLALSAEAGWWLLHRLRPSLPAPRARMMTTQIAWRVSVASLLILVWLSHSASRSGGHLRQAERAFAGGDAQLAARLLRQVEPRELPRRAPSPSSASQSLPAYPGGSLDPRWRILSRDLASLAPADCIRPALAAAEYDGGRPDRARRVMDTKSLRDAGLPWPDPKVPTRAGVYRYLRSVSEGTRSAVQMRTFHALIAREVARAEPGSVEDRLAYARAAKASVSTSLLPPGETLYAEVLELDPRNREALLACGRVVEASRIYPNDVDILRLRLKGEKSPAQREKTLRAIVRLDRDRPVSEAKELVKQAIAAGDLPKALRDLETVRRYREYDGSTYYWKKRGWILAEAGRYPDALAAYDKAQTDHSSWDTHSTLSYKGITYLQMRDIRHARDAFAAAGDPSYPNMADLFAAWCADKITPPASQEPGEVDHLLLAQPRSNGWSLAFPNASDDDFTRQAERILKDYPDCFPAAVLLVSTFAYWLSPATDIEAERRVCSILAPFAKRFPQQVDQLQEPFVLRVRAARRSAAKGDAAPARTR